MPCIRERRLLLKRSYSADELSGMTLLLDLWCQMVREKPTDFGSSFDPPTSNILTTRRMHAGILVLQILLLIVELRQQYVYAASLIQFPCYQTFLFILLQFIRQATVCSM